MINNQNKKKPTIYQTMEIQAFVSLVVPKITFIINHEKLAFRKEFIPCLELQLDMKVKCQICPFLTDATGWS